MNNKAELTAEEVIGILGLVPLEGEGGLWSQGHVSDEYLPGSLLDGRDTPRPLFSTIYYMLTPDSFSCMHKLCTDEVWYHHTGAAARLLLIRPDAAQAGGYSSEIRLLGSDLMSGAMPQITVPRGTYMGCVMDITAPEHAGCGYTLMSTSMAPAYQDSDYEAGSYEELAAFTAPEHLSLLRSLCLKAY